MVAGLVAISARITGTQGARAPGEICLDDPREDAQLFRISDWEQH